MLSKSKSTLPTWIIVLLSWTALQPLIDARADCLSPPGGMVAWWSGDTDSSDVFGQLHGSLQGSASNALGIVGGAFDLHPGGYITVPDSSLLNPTNAITVEAWVFQRSQSSNAPVVAKGNGYNNGYILSIKTGTPNFIIAGIGFGGGVVNTNQWTHLAGTFDGTDRRLYVNGVVKSSVYSAATGSLSQNSLNFGRDTSNTNGQFDGLIDEVSIYNRALSTGEVAAIYAASSAGKCKPPPGPPILIGPSNKVVSAGLEVFLSIAATGWELPLNYQWQLDGTNLPSATNWTFSLTNAQSANAGAYTVIVTNSYRSMTSSVAILTVTSSIPILTSQPQSVTTSSGQNFTVGVSAYGTEPLSYQWHFNSAIIVGATNSYLSLTNVQPSSGGSYFVVVSNSAGITSSSNAFLSVIIPDFYSWTTIAGLAGACGSADGTNQSARFSGPSNLAVDSSGSVYVSDRGNSTIRKLTPMGTNWVVSTIAGLAEQSGSVDGTNSMARFNSPSGVAVHNDGSVYVADWQNNTIRKITPIGSNWVVSTIAGLAGASGSNDGTNTAARFWLPQGPAVDAATNVYVADLFNSTIRKIIQVGTNWVVSTIAGQSSGSADGTNRAARFTSPSGVAVDNNGNVYVADQSNHTIRKLRPESTNWIVTTIAGLAGVRGSADGTNSTARFNSPGGLAVDSATNIYVADLQNNTIRKITPIGSNWVVTTTGGLAATSGSVDGIASEARFAGPNGVAMDTKGNLYVADYSNCNIRRGVPLPVFQSSSLTNGLLTLTWRVSVGQVLQAQYKTDLNQSDWIDLGGSITSVNSLASISDSVIGETQRFYRLIPIP